MVYQHAVRILEKNDGFKADIIVQKISQSEIKFATPLFTKEIILLITEILKLKSYLLPGESNQLNISEKELKEGIYFYNVISNGKKIKQDKIIIIK